MRRFDCRRPRDMGASCPVNVIPDQLPWWVAGPGVGLCVVALYALAGVKLGVSGGWLQLLFLAQRRPVSESWRLWFTGALVVGAFLAPVLGTGRVSGYGDSPPTCRCRRCSSSWSRSVP